MTTAACNSLSSHVLCHLRGMSKYEHMYMDQVPADESRQPLHDDTDFDAADPLGRRATR